MFQKNTFSIPSDSSGILLVKVIQTRKSSNTKHAKVGKFLRVVNKNTKVKLRKRKKKKSRAICIRSNHDTYVKKGYYYKFQDNAVVLLRKRMNARGKEIIGPTSKKLKIKKFKISFKYIY